MSQAILLDTSLYMALFRHPGTIDVERAISGGELWLSAVVLEELYAGADRHQLRMIEILERGFAANARLLVPALEDWKQTGVVLSRLALTYGYEEIRRGRLTNDALMAVSAGRCGASLRTLNRKDFALLAEFWQFDWQLVSLSAS